MREAFHLRVLKTDAPVSVRRATSADLDIIVEIERHSFSVPWSRETLREEMEESTRSTVQVAELGAVTAGFMIYWTVVDEIHLLNLAVHPDWRRKGIAAALMHQLMIVARSNNIEDILLEVRVSNRNAQLLYRKFGFRPMGIRERYYSDNGEDAIVMCHRRDS